MMWKLACLVATLLVIPHGVEAQGLKPVAPPHPAVTSTFLAEPGVQVEGAGLKRWTLQMIQDSLDVHAPGVTFVAGTCGAELRRLPLFLQAVVAANAADSAVTIFVAVIEPQDSALITVRALSGAGAASAIVVPWPEVIDLGRTRLVPLMAGITASIQARGAGLEPRVPVRVRRDSSDLVQVWNALDAHRTADDAALARLILTTSTDVYDRVAAVAVLSNFDRDDATWHALVGALLDPDEMVREYARSVLRAFATHLSRPVDWRAATPELHALLQGSDLWSLNATLDMLVATDVGPELASELLNGGGHGVLIFAGAKNEWFRGPAHRFLRAVSGEVATRSPQEWRTWIASL